MTRYDDQPYVPRHARRPRTARRAGSVLLAATAALVVVAGAQFTREGPPAARGSTPTAVPSSTVAPASPSARPSPATSRPPGSSAAVPDGAQVPVKGTGSWRVVPGASGTAGHGAVRTYTVEVEDGVVPPDGDAVFAATVQATLADRRSWIGGGVLAVRRIDAGEPDVRIRLASQRTARLRCGFEIPIDVSCRDGGTVYLSAVRWIRGAVAFGDDLASYRQYMVNHEVGHFFGKGHRPCPAHGGLAPVMMQQTFSTSNNEILDITAGYPQGAVIPRDGKVCAANPWPYPLPV